MFKSFYGLTFNPFDKSIPEGYAFCSRDHKQMLSRLDYLKNTRGIGLFTAPPGMGKTFALRCFAKTLNPNLFQLSYICLSTVSVSEFYHQFCFELGLDYNSKKIVMFRNIQERLLNFFKEKRKTFILAIDESQYLNTGILSCEILTLTSPPEHTINGIPFFWHPFTSIQMEGTKQNNQNNVCDLRSITKPMEGDPITGKYKHNYHL